MKNLSLTLKAGADTVVPAGASASGKGYAQSAPFAAGKFALGGLAQRMARELARQNIHVAHAVIDDGIRCAARPVPADTPDSLRDPDASTQRCVHLVQQQRSPWTWEIDILPELERVCPPVNPAPDYVSTGQPPPIGVRPRTDLCQRNRAKKVRNMHTN